MAALREKCPNTEFSVNFRIQFEDGKKLRIWTLFAQFVDIKIVFQNTCSYDYLCL